MESVKDVIQIIKKASNQFEYDEHYYFTEISVADGKTNILTTCDIWKATRFNCMTPNIANNWCSFIKSFFGKHYEVCVKTIKLNYNLDNYEC